MFIYLPLVKIGYFWSSGVNLVRAEVLGNFIPETSGAEVKS